MVACQNMYRSRHVYANAVLGVMVFIYVSSIKGRITQQGSCHAFPRNIRVWDYGRGYSHMADFVFFSVTWLTSLPTGIILRYWSKSYFQTVFGYHVCSGR